MSGEQRRPEAPKGPPWSLDLLADYHAGVLDEDTAEQVRLTVESDPEAQETLAALTATTNELAGLAPMSIPEDIASKVESAIAEQAQLRAAEAQPSEAHPATSEAAAGSAAGPDDHSNVIDIRRRRRRRMSWGALLVASAAVVGGVITTPLIMNSGEDTSAQPEPSEAGAPPSDAPPTPGPSPLALSDGGAGNVTLTQQQFGETLRSEQYAGSLRQPERLTACLEANDVDNPRPLGAREVTVDGRPGQLFILPSGEVGQFRLLTVGTECGPDNPETISDSTFGG